MNATPTTGHSSGFRGSSFERSADGRIHSRMVDKNAQPVIDGLLPYLIGLSGHALEIGSGTGQHVIAFSQAFPDLRWTPSEPDPVHRASIDAWRVHENADTSLSIGIDAAIDWAGQPELAKITPLRLILCLNVIHISAFKVASGIITGAGKTLSTGGLLAFYGPFREKGRHTGEGNATFDARLRADNPNWGVRDVAEITDLGQNLGLKQVALVKMPANNRILLLKKS